MGIFLLALSATLIVIASTYKIRNSLFFLGSYIIYITTSIYLSLLLNLSLLRILKNKIILNMLSGFCSLLSFVFFSVFWMFSTRYYGGEGALVIIPIMWVVGGGFSVFISIVVNIVMCNKALYPKRIKKIWVCPQCGNENIIYPLDKLFCKHCKFAVRKII